MKYYPMVWLLWCNDKNGKYLVEVLAHKITAEALLRALKKSYDDSAHYWIQEKDVNQTITH